MPTKRAKIEIGRCGKPIGKQDQYIAAFGGIRAIEFHPDEMVTVDHVALSDSDLRHFSANLMLFYTNRTRSSAEILKEQKTQTNDRRKILEAMLPLVEQIRLALTNGQFDAVGHTLHEAWTLKKQMASKISDSDIDGMYKKARKTGALGGKIAGAGGGGFLLLYVPLEHQARVRKRTLSAQ